MKNCSGEELSGGGCMSVVHDTGLSNWLKIELGLKPYLLIERPRRATTKGFEKNV